MKFMMSSLVICMFYLISKVQLLIYFTIRYHKREHLQELIDIIGLEGDDEQLYAEGATWKVLQITL